MSELFGIKKVGPNRYREDPGRYFEDFNIGDIYEHWPGRTITETDNIWFTNLTMNTHPVHFDANYASKTIGIRGEADLLLVIKVKVDGTWEELYFDDFQKALSIANFSKRDNKHSISITALKKIK